MAQQKLRYSEFWDQINVDAVEEAIGWSPDYQRGNNDVGYCIWPENHNHGDTTGKFAIEREARVYNCYVCGGGSLLDLAMQTQDLDVDDATEWLYQFTEADMRTDSEFVDEFLDAFRDVEKRIETLPYFNERVLERFAWDPVELPEGLEDWAVDRFISFSVLSQYKVGYSDSIRRPAPRNGRFADDEDYEGPGIVFPHYWKGRLVGWQTRWLDNDRPEWVPKYTMTTDFPKETTIYGWDQLGNAAGPVLVVESVPSALFAVTNGQPSVATFGSNVNDAQLRLLRRLQGGVVLAPDNDQPKGDKTPAGIKWRDALSNYLKRYIPVWHLPPVEGDAGADVGDLAKKDDPQGSLIDYLRQMREPGVDL